ncbi:multidrug ABC transporter substrate-binding protein [Candidatus Nomurabacteria bacterium CG_4_9_14_0_2_um_filter_32_10]|uniref:Multidrug ABC transporter substrate-binding protein n=3 Tax=Candidatus Nomuraibacteriota TaxID=1752729 RepID=A0A2H0CGC5_9BACT|nr:MAG: multidrug ABC transporter substrate-binding protein [Candidatus Nomurabacteria bacterium CG22_combo_CG10-13_8_21_14_all_32_8]PIZ86160.1 MAG: multidrug ABC transporter substrate-binding protein [Candidatus Nomurabacteria bacterium CG_4_10_14_0_2_um_filter_33_9]PJC49387.1 MAG: multidrug ABC transporter substrate-binding protein [Candidatus Nomurabacteria bacterium CG_4_9_14_0_2_um_filter_32_10]
MKIRDIANETYSSLSANKVRSGLTMLGIVIGIASVIAMVSIGNGAKESISSSIEGLGSNLLTIMPGVVQPGRGIVSSGRGSAQTLKNEDADVIKTIDGVAAVSPEVSSRFQVVATGNNTNTTISGVTTDYMNVHNVALADGSFISDANERSMGRQAVLGATVATDLFPEEDPIGKTVRINKINFNVIGVLVAKGGVGFSGPDDMIFVPLSTMQKILSGMDYLSTMSVSVTDKDKMTEVKDLAINALLNKHNVDEADFSVISQEDILGTLTTVIDTFTLFLAAIASISLLVGGIGIMNMMLTTVTERTKEIGLRKAIGAKRKDINLQFLSEAVMLTFIGGFLGIILGWLISFIVTSTGLIATSVSLSSVLLAFGVSTGIGIIFGYYPARRAGMLNPIDALRYE